MANPKLFTHPCIHRYEGNPVMTCKDVPYPSTLVFNAGVIRYQGRYAMTFRNDYEHISQAKFAGTNIGLAFSDDGIHWKVEPQPVFALQDKEIVRAYDPRLTDVEGQIYMTFAVDTRHGVCGGIAEYFNIDPTLVRLGWVVFCALGGSGVLAYIVAAILIPENPVY